MRLTIPAYGLGACLLVATAACGSPSRTHSQAFGVSGIDASTGEASDSGSESTSESGEDDAAIRQTGYAERLDLPAEADQGCDKIDFLFVIDDSGSMADEQQRLIAGFPGFLESIGASIQQYDYHLMVVTTGAPTHAPETCADQAGAGRTSDAEGDSCPLTSDDALRYVDADEEDLAAAFSCIADVGTVGNGNERPIWAMTQAVTTRALPGGCNEGFLRDDAVLVVTIITDEEDDAGVDSPGDPEIWRDVMVAAKHGNEEAVVVLGLLGDTDLSGGECEPFMQGQGGEGAEAAPRLREFVESFTHGSWASVCQPDYAPFFNEAVDGVGQACHDFVPPG